MARFEKPAEGTWTEHYPELGRGRVSFEDSISPAFYELEREAIFKRAWLYVGRVEQLPRNGSYFTKELPGVRTAIVVSRDMNGRVRAFHNVCRHPGNKLLWEGTPRNETCGSARQFVCKYQAGGTASTARAPTCTRRTSSSICERKISAWLRCTARPGPGSSS